MERIQNGTSMEEAEDDIVGVRHPQIGCWLAEKWNLPKIITDTILHHHDPWNSKKEQLLVATVHLANYLSHICGMGHSGRTAPPELDIRLWELFQKSNVPIDVPDIATLQSEFLLEFDKSESFLNFISDGEEKD
jgi:HD-like signal output (HDOD) protein